MRPAFTLVETLVALVLLEFGMLALLATSAVVARDLAGARRIDRARDIARNRVELLVAERCPAPGSYSTAHPGGMTEFWRVTADGQQRRITDSILIALPRGRVGRVRLLGASWCRD